MRKAIQALAVLTMLLCISSCDFLRGLAGRPTSEDIRDKRILIERTERAEQDRLDSLEKVRRHVADSISLDDTIMASGLVVPMKFKSQSLPKKYCVMIGTFSQKSNAESVSKKLSAEGFETIMIPLRNGSCAVAACPTDGLQEVFSAYVKLTETEFCPDDICIMSNE